MQRHGVSLEACYKREPPSGLLSSPGHCYTSYTTYWPTLRISVSSLILKLQLLTPGLAHVGLLPRLDLSQVAMLGSEFLALQVHLWQVLVVGSLLMLLVLLLLVVLLVHLQLLACTEIAGEVMEA